MHPLLGDLTLSSQRGRHMSIFPVHQLTRFAISLSSSSDTHVQSSAIVGSPGLVNFITAVAYHFCPSLPAAFTQPGASTLADLCTYSECKGDRVES